MLIHCGLLVQLDAILIEEDILLLVQHINDGLCSLVCSLFVSCSEHSLYYRGAEQRVALCRSLLQKSIPVIFEILEILDIPDQAPASGDSSKYRSPPGCRGLFCVVLLTHDESANKVGTHHHIEINYCFRK